MAKKKPYDHYPTCRECGSKRNTRKLLSKSTTAVYKYRCLDCKHEWEQIN